ncbi:MAG: hybrid sensor histidine kinase/response regulator [Lentimonas sp.]
MSTKHKPKILVVDDQPINIKLLQSKLERQGMEVLVAYNGRECLSIVEKTIPDLILLDVMMPEMDGIETCRHLKAKPETAMIPVIFVTAKASKEGKLEGLDAGAVDYITKPIDLDETLARVRTQLRSQEIFRENLDLQERLGEVRNSAAVGAINQGIAHNLNNLLGVVVGYLDLIKNGYDRPDMVKRSVGLMDNSITRMVDIIRQLRTIANNDRIELTPNSISTLIQNSIARFQKKSESSNSIDIITDLDDSMKVNANAETFESILGRLLANAWESYPKGTTDQNRVITVEAAITSNHGVDFLEVNVIDQGAGIKPKIKDRVFEPFTTSKTSAGRGVGLTIARHALRDLGGDARITESPEGGVTATMIHPL